MDRDYKKCTKCNYHKPLDSFPKNSKGLFGRASVCKVCSAKIAKQYRQQHPIQKAALKFKTTEEEIKKVWYKTNCDICGVGFKPTKRHAIDHDHKTGEIRGLLCDSCNTGLGKFKDSPEILQRASDYLKERYAK